MPDARSCMFCIRGSLLSYIVFVHRRQRRTMSQLVGASISRAKTKQSLVIGQINYLTNTSHRMRTRRYPRRPWKSCESWRRTTHTTHRASWFGCVFSFFFFFSLSLIFPQWTEVKLRAAKRGDSLAAPTQRHCVAALEAARASQWNDPNVHLCVHAFFYLRVIRLYLSDSSSHRISWFKIPRANCIRRHTHGLDHAHVAR
jgi:hypothetical protein